MTSAGTLATETVAQWLLLDAGDPACNDARDAVGALGRPLQEEAALSASKLRIPLAATTAHCADEGEIARALGDLRRELGSLDTSELDAEQGLFARTIAMVPGVGTPASRYSKRLESARPRMASIIESLEAGRAVLTRDNITLRSDQQRLHDLSASLEQEIDNVQAFDDALGFAVDVELPFGDLRRPLFEDELLVTVRQRLSALAQTLAVSQHGVAAIESVMSENRELIRGIDRTRNLTLGALSVASTAGVEIARKAEAFDEVDAVLNEVDTQRREALPTMERTVRDVTP